MPVKYITVIKMSDFWLYVTIGLRHVLDINGYDHVLFLMALTVPYTFRDWRNVLLLVTLFTIGHTMSLILSVYGIVTLPAAIIEFLIPVTILSTALFNIYKAGKSPRKENVNAIAFITLFFGVVHGLGFSNYFKVLVDTNSEEKMVHLLEFALGIETAQIVVVTTVLILSYIIINVLKRSRRDWILVTSAFVAGVILPLIIESEIW